MKYKVIDNFLDVDYFNRLVTLFTDNISQDHQPKAEMSTTTEPTSLMVSNTDSTGWGGPNVDNKYYRARIDGDSTYTLRGNVDSLYDIAIQANKGDMHGRPPWKDRRRRQNTRENKEKRGSQKCFGLNSQYFNLGRKIRY